MWYKKSLNKNSGFTLLELLVVIAIIGILASIVIASLSDSRAKARDARRKADAHTIQTALELYYAKCGTYTITLNCVNPGTISNIYGSNVNANVSFTHGFNQNFNNPGSVAQGLVDNGILPAIIEDPNGVASTSAYVLMIPYSGKSYSLIMKLEKPTQADIDTTDINWTFGSIVKCPVPNTWWYPGASWLWNATGYQWTLGGRNYCVTNPK